MTNNQQNIQTNNQQKSIKNLLNLDKVFDPRIIDENDSNKQLWSTDSVELANNGLREGYKLKDNPYLKTVKGASLRKANVPFKYTEEELKIIRISIKDKIFFGNNFTKLKDGNQGWVNINLRDYQRKLLHQYTKERWSIIMFPRQSGKTTTTAIEIVHFLTFNIDKDCVVVAQNQRSVNEILQKIKEVFAGLPFFLQPGFVSFTKDKIVLDNGCRLSIGVASESTVQGFSLDLLYIDEFAYIKNSMVRKFWNNIYPALVNNKQSRCIITSTPNGRNYFYELWTAAVAKNNMFVPYRIYWTDVPGRDEQFKKETIANVGLEGWLMGFECSFDTSLKSIFHSLTQTNLRFLQTEYIEKWSYNNHPIGNKYNIEFVNQDVVQYDLKNDYFLIGVDIGEGLSQDFSILKIKKIEWDKINKRLLYKSIGIYKDNEIGVDDFAQHTLDIIKEFNPNKLRVIVENNNYGGEFFNQINNLKIFTSKYSTIDNQVWAQFERKSKNGFEYGIRWNQYNKKIGVRSFSKLVENESFIETNNTSIEEYLNFGKQANGTYSANYGHDDLVMADISISYFLQIGNIWSKSYLNNAETELRILAKDEPIEVLKAREEAERKERQRFTHRGFTQRNHEESYQKRLERTSSDVVLLFF